MTSKFLTRCLSLSNKAVEQAQKQIEQQLQTIAERANDEGERVASAAETNSATATAMPARSTQGGAANSGQENTKMSKAAPQRGHPSTADGETQLAAAAPTPTPAGSGAGSEPADLAQKPLAIDSDSSELWLLARMRQWFTRGKHNRTLRSLAVIVSIVVIAYLTHNNAQALRTERALLTQIQAHGADVTALETIAVTNQMYLRQIEQQGLDDLLIIVEISSLLNVVASSQVGVSVIADFHVTVGHLLKDLNRALQRAVEINLAAVAAARILGIGARVGHFVAPYLMLLCLGLWSTYALLVIAKSNKWLSRQVLNYLAKIAVCTTVLLVFVHLLLPYSLYFSSLLSQQMHADTQRAASEKLAHAQHAVRHLSHHDSLSARAKSSISHLQTTAVKGVHQQTENIFAYLLWRIALGLCNLVLLPLAILVALLWLMRAVLPRLVQSP